jgi:hypothetical protein
VPNADVVGNQQSHRRQLQRHHQGHQLVRFGSTPRVRGARERAGSAAARKVQTVR